MIQAFDTVCNKASIYLDHHPILYKTALIICHIFRSAMVYAMLYTSPFIGLGILVPLSLLYRISVERFCAIRFTLPSLFGGISMYLTKISPLGIIPLTAYSIMIFYTSHRDVKYTLPKLNKNCCR